ncbi:MAG: TonB-dependent receptor [Asticcacaulis sp.]
MGYTTGQILSLPEDDPLIFQVTEPTNSDQTAELKGWEFNIQHSFGDSGFGGIVNYTKVDGDAVYDNTQPASVAQFALTGLSDSANVVAFYDKNGIQARIAYNWRDQFLNGGGPNPTYTDAYGQFDGSASWEFKPGVTAFIEGINLTNESRKLHQRSENNVTFVAPGYARYDIGVRMTF